MTVQALLKIIAFIVPVLAGGLASNVEGSGCYGEAEDATAIDIVIPAVTGLLVNKDPSVIDKYWSENFTQHDPDFPNGKEPLFTLVDMPFEYTLERVVAQGDLVVIHARVTGVGPKPVIIMDLFRVEGDLIVEHWDVLQSEVPASETVSGRARGYRQKDAYAGTGTRTVKWKSAGTVPFIPGSRSNKFDLLGQGVPSIVPGMHGM
jgi:predicted SnoaL-like aldol condensation-catalyzing enzyme